MLNIISWVIIALSLVLILTSSFLYQRKGEAEISQSLTSLPTFRISIALMVIGVILKIVVLFI